jgi:hypothetical protein
MQNVQNERQKSPHLCLALRARQKNEPKSPEAALGERLGDLTYTPRQFSVCADPWSFF